MSPWRLASRLASDLLSSRRLRSQLRGVYFQQLVDGLVQGYESSPEEEEEWAEKFGHVPSPWVQALANLVPQPVLQVDYNGIDLTGLLSSWDLSLQLNGKEQANLDLLGPRDENGLVVVPSDLCPPGYGVFENVIRQAPAGGSVARPFRLNLRWAGEDFPLPIMVGGPVTWDHPRLRWPLTSIADHWDQEREDWLSLPDILLAGGDRRTAHSAAKEEGKLLGIQVVCNYPNYLLGEFRRGSGSPLARLNALAAPMQAYGRIVRGCLVYDQVKLGPVAARFEDCRNIRVLSIDELPKASNKFTMSRLTTGGGTIGEAGGLLPGLIEISFEPSRTVTIETIKVWNGSLVNWCFWANTDFLTGGPGAPEAYSGGREATRATASYVPTIHNFATQYGWEIVARGDSLQRDESYIFNTEYSDAPVHVSFYGENPSRQALSFPQIGDAAGAARAIKAYLFSSIRRVWSARLETPYVNPVIQPGITISIKDRLRRQNHSKWIVEDVRPARRNGKAAGMAITAVRGEGAPWQ